MLTHYMREIGITFEALLLEIVKACIMQQPLEKISLKFPGILQQWVSLKWLYIDIIVTLRSDCLVL